MTAAAQLALTRPSLSLCAVALLSSYNISVLVVLKSLVIIMISSRSRHALSLSVALLKFLSLRLFSPLCYFRRTVPLSCPVIVVEPSYLDLTPETMLVTSATQPLCEC